MTINTKTFFAVLLGILLGAVAMRAEPLNRTEELAQADIDKKQAVIDRPLYVTPAPKDFKPTGTGSIIELKLTLKKTKIRRGTPIRYRFEITNVGSEPFLFGEFTQSFFKTGRLPSDAITMKIKDPSGKTQLARSAFPKRSDTVRGEIRLPPGLTEAQRAGKVVSMKRNAQAAVTLLQRLAPGETLHTRGDTPVDEFRTLNIDSWFNLDGTYELSLVYSAFSKYEKSSNHVRLEVVP